MRGRWRIHFKSKPGMYELYDGYLDVPADTYEQALDRAYAQLRRQYGRGPDCWIVEKGQVLPT